MSDVMSDVSYLQHKVDDLNRKVTEKANKDKLDALELKCFEIQNQLDDIEQRLFDLIGKEE